MESKIKMKAVRFGNKKVLQINDPVIKNEINNSLENYGINYSDRNYKFLDSASIDYLKINKHLVTLSSFGKKYLLYITKINNKKYCFFICKKTNNIVSVRYRFKENIFCNTLIDGELLKDNENNWIFSIIDIIVYKGNFLDKHNLNERLEILSNLVNKEYNEDTNFDIAKLKIKKYFEYCYMNDLSTRYVENLNYKCCGFIFKNLLINEKYLLFIFEENRTKKIVDDNKIVNNKNNKTIPSFIIKKTDLPDIYELYCSKDNRLFKYGIASINTISCSKFIKDIIKDNEDTYVKCSYNKIFNKWVPYSLTNSISDYNSIKKLEEIN